MKKLFITSLILFPLLLQARMGNDQGNGGDPQEAVFMDISRNIEAWIKSGNAEQLVFESEMTYQRYAKSMLRVLRDYQIQFTDRRIIVKEVEKTCKNWHDENQKNQVLCNTRRFSQASLEQQYRLVHHEFAGLAGVEVMDNQKSDYRISDQISGYLQDEVVKRLPIIQGGKSDGAALSELRRRYREFVKEVGIPTNSQEGWKVRMTLLQTYFDVIPNPNEVARINRSLIRLTHIPEGRLCIPYEPARREPDPKECRLMRMQYKSGVDALDRIILGE